MADLLPCRILIDAPPQSGAWNMAVDEVLLETALGRGIATVRVYEWAVPTISLGYFQDADSAGEIPGLETLPRVRRLSGGGAILHHHELTYSLALPAAHPLAAEPGRVYEAVHQRIISMLETFGVSTRMRGEAAAPQNARFLCFARGDARDILLNRQKILGSAQRRRRGALLQHGSLLLRHSECAPQISGIHDLSSGADFHGLQPALAEAIASSLSDRPSAGTLSDEERARGEELVRRRYSSLNWRSRADSAAGVTVVPR